MQHREMEKPLKWDGAPNTMGITVFLKWGTGPLKKGDRPPEKRGQAPES